MRWPEEGPTLGGPHPGFFYPDPLGFWTEIRRWIVALVPAPASPPPGGWGLPEQLAVSALVGGLASPEALCPVLGTCRPRCVLFLDEAAWAAGEITLVGHTVAHHIPDPHRANQVYEGFWGRTGDGVVVGKSPQHPAAHRLYGPGAMQGFLRAAPSAG